MALGKKKTLFISSMNQKENMQHILLIIPSLAVVIAIAIFPLVYAARTSFYSLSLLRPAGSKFVGLANYLDVLSRLEFWHSVTVTLTLSALAVAIELLVGLLVALVLAGKFAGAQLLRTGLSVPVMIAPLAAGIIFLIIFNSTFGVMNYFLKVVSLEPQLWLGQPNLAFAAVVVADVWRATPFMMLVLIAGLQSIPREEYESAWMDGAGRWVVFFRITLPSLKRFILVGVVFRIIDALRMYDTIYVLTDGGPARATETLSVFIYRYGFSEYRMGFTSAATVIFLVIVVAVTYPLAKHASTQAA
jgi:multiple sugar transport system permease protein